MTANPAWSKDRGSGFYFGAACAGVLITLVGFHLTYTQPLIAGSYSGPWWGHIHGALAMAWLALFVVQSWMAPRKLSLHRSLGVLALAIIPLWFASTVMIAREFAQMTVAAGNAEQARDNIAGALSSPLLVMIIVALALHFRKRPQAHKRLIFIATVLMLWPSWSRWRHYFPEPEAVHTFFALFVAMAPIPLAMLRDRLKFGAIHPALLWGGLFVMAEQGLEVVLSGTPAWNALSHLLFDLLV